MENVKRTTQISSNIGRTCEHCHESVGGWDDGGDISASINHFIEAHGYQLLHVGAQAATDRDGKPCHFTVAILGHDDPPALAEPVKMSFGDFVFGEPPASLNEPKKTN